MSEHFSDPAFVDGRSPPKLRIDSRSGQLTGPNVTTLERRLGDLVGVFADEMARQALDQQQVVYRVVMHAAVAESTAGGLFFGTSFVEPGQVGDEYFMTKGHFHEKPDAAEYYWGVSGEGALLLMNRERRCWAEQVLPGSLHYIPGNVAHRLVNTGSTTLVVGACWPADAGHDYAAIARQGFSARLLATEGRPRLTPAPQP